MIRVSERTFFSVDVTGSATIAAPVFLAPAIKRSSIDFEISGLAASCTRTQLQSSDTDLSPFFTDSERVRPHTTRRIPPKPYRLKSLSKFSFWPADTTRIISSSKHDLLRF